jgi:uncharacterized protein
MRSLADRLVAVRSERPVPERPPARDRAAALAAWFDALLTERVVVVERSVPLPAGVASALAVQPSACYLDTETTGLSTGAGTVAFLVAAGRVEGARFVVRQYLLPDYPDEVALLRGVAAELRSAERLVTYNGRSFDLPLLVARLTMNGLFAELGAVPPRHDDLLPVARRLWRRPLGGARLAMIEAGVLGVRRASDCPSSEVPLRWFEYLRGGSPDLLAPVLDHNFQDVVSLALLESELARLRAGGWREARVLDRRGMALELLRGGGDEHQALTVLEEALALSEDRAEAVALRRLAARLLVAGGELARAEAMWRAGTRQASVEAAEAWIEVARIRERHARDLSGALEATRSAARVLDLAFALGRGGGMAELGRVRLRVDARLRRLVRWVAAAERRATRRARVA